MSMKINIPFKKDIWQRNLELMAQGKVGRTRRNIKYGSPGDFFERDGKNYILISVSKRQLHDEAYDEATVEEFGSTEKFIKVWTGFYPKRGFRPYDMVWVHVFIPESRVT